MYDDAFCNYFGFLSGKKETADVCLYGVDLGHIQKLVHRVERYVDARDI